MAGAHCEVLVQASYGGCNASYAMRGCMKAGVVLCAAKPLSSCWSWLLVVVKSYGLPAFGHQPQALGA
eukprot:1140350-Pelagomonas_calceolata.AAC.5